MEAVDKEMVEQWVKEGHSYEWISDALTAMYPAIERGLSARSVRRYCCKYNIKRLTDDQLDEVVQESVHEVQLYRFTECMYMHH